ncbi:MAG: ATP phosphoribosyltransferase [Dehalococcoidia bacterium]|uniref:ATP phosphoribosyltransferase n=1 Tax=Candidatus Amarobacter glycogenicus TaxID=3140699 RepID=UPI001DB9A49D|nr:ATP phosphoribosyltransferase [Dehalococcoidia bacterium]MBK7724229.1 ATP phosphoribosyltransferase [Dehalococcoidia bacterium]MBK9545739.1 ATP phosphoribosyltransferase [Dehalococcoidia bacterium]MBK9613456.1 ATP phosphoribosyltransferase [Dehalococcoidia bacterium]
MIKVALPNKGMLFEPTIELLNSCGYRVSKVGSALSFIDPENEVEFYFLRPGDIPLYVANGMLDCGITGKDFVAEKGVEHVKLLDLNYGQSKLRAAVPNDSPVQTLEQFADLTIATSLPGIVRAFFAPRELQIIELEGAVEIAVQLGIAQAVVDVVDTGTTLKQAGLRVVGDPLFLSNAALFAHHGREAHHQLTVLKQRIQGKLVAVDYMMVEYDTPGDILQRACEITPGLESPTITQLQREGWYSVKAMVKRRDAHRIMDELSAIGCRGILLTSIESARI